MYTADATLYIQSAIQSVTHDRRIIMHLLNK